MEQKEVSPPLRVVIRYILLQIPGFALFGLVLVLSQRWFFLPLWLFGCLMLLWVLKDVILFSMVWRSYESQEEADDPKLIDAQGVAFERLAPFGYIRIHGELWKAELISGVLPVEKGETVQVIGRNNLVLTVKKIEPGDKPLPQPEAQPNSSGN